MPSSVNGIGTHYYGKKNLEQRPGDCEFCRRDALLSSYDTRLWFVIFFIPIIPLGKKRILNYCPHCTRHRVLSLHEWEKLKKDNISAAMEAVKANPQDAKAARKLHSTLIAFGQSAEAEKLGKQMMERFANDAETQVYLGSTMQFIGKHSESIPFYQQALKLNPELPEARVAIGLDLIKKRQLDEAHKLLQFLETPGPDRYPGPLFALATGYQEANRHREAAALFAILTEQFPKLAQDKAFRKAVKKSETALGVQESKLPPRPQAWGRIIGWSVALLVILAIPLGSNFYVSQHRTLYLVSGFDKQVTVEIPGHGKKTITSTGVWTMELPEGTYEASITGPVQQKSTFTIQSSFWKRWSDKPVYILNVGNSALLIYETATYSSRTAAEDYNEPGGNYKLYFDQPFIAIPQVDYRFESFPERIQMAKHSGRTEKKRIGLFRNGAVAGILMLAGESRFKEALSLAEWHLRLHPEDTELLPLYAHFSKEAKSEPRALAYVTEAVKRRPVELEWHRIYQELRLNTQDAAPLIAEYDGLLNSDPQNSTLLYLRGRLCVSKKQAIGYYEKALAQNPTNHMAHYALGQSHADCGDWALARPHLAEAVRLKPKNSQFKSVFFTARLALQEFSELESELKTATTREPSSYGNTSQLGQVLIAENKREEVEKLLASYQKQFQAKQDETDESTFTQLKSQFLYASGQFDELEKLTGTKKALRRVPGRFSALVEQGKLPEAAELLQAKKVERIEPFEVLALSLAWKNAGKEEEADRYRKQAIASMTGDRHEYAKVVEFLKRDQPVPLEELADLSLQPQPKAVLLIAMAQRFPTDNAGMLSLARKLNVNRDFPYHLINRLTAPAVAGQSQK